MKQKLGKRLANLKMKINIFSILATLILLFSCTTEKTVREEPRVSQRPKPPALIILSFARYNISSEEADSLYSDIVKEIGRLDNFTLMDEDDAKEKAMQNGVTNEERCSSFPCAIETAKAAGVDLSVYGLMVKTNDIYTISASLASAESSNVIKRVVLSFSSLERQTGEAIAMAIVTPPIGTNNIIPDDINLDSLKSVLIITNIPEDAFTLTPPKEESDFEKQFEILSSPRFSKIKATGSATYKGKNNPFGDGELTLQVKFYHDGSKKRDRVSLEGGLLNSVIVDVLAVGDMLYADFPIANTNYKGPMGDSKLQIGGQSPAQILKLLGFTFVDLNKKIISTNYKDRAEGDILTVKYRDYIDTIYLSRSGKTVTHVERSIDGKVYTLRFNDYTQVNGKWFPRLITGIDSEGGEEVRLNFNEIAIDDGVKWDDGDFSPRI